MNEANILIVEDTARTTDSSGLGLTIVSKLVENLEGQIEAKTTPNTFKIEISFPLAH